MSITALNIIYPIALFTFLTRTLGPNSFGQFSVALSLATYFTQIASLGLPLYAMRAMGAVSNKSPESKRKQASSLILLNGGFSILAALTFYLFIAISKGISPGFGPFELYLVLGLQIGLNAFNVDFILYGLEQPAPLFFRFIFVRVLTLAALWHWVHGAKDLVAVAGILIISTAAQAFWTSALAFKSLGGITLSNNYWPHLKAMRWTTLSVFLSYTYNALDPFILGFITSNQEVGYYNIVARTLRMGTTLLGAIGIAILPRLASFQSTGQHPEMQQLQTKSIRLVWLLSLPGWLVMVFIAKPLVRFWLGEKFLTIGPTLEFSGIFFLIAGTAQYLAVQGLYAENKDKSLCLLSLIGAGTFLIFNFELTPRYGHVGAIASLLLAETCVLITALVLARDKLRIMKESLPDYKIGIALFAMLSILFLGHFKWAGRGPMLGVGALSGIIYGLALLTLREPTFYSLIRRTK